jgi:hypothetical protein
MELLGTYSITRIDEKNYDLSFNIPDNCNYSIADNNSIYDITIKLNKGETQPSTKFNTEKYSCSTYNGIIDIIFTQEDYLVLAASYNTRPKIRIDING